jgi:hypothetical protein
MQTNLNKKIPHPSENKKYANAQTNTTQTMTVNSTLKMVCNL